MDKTSQHRQCSKLAYYLPSRYQTGEEKTIAGENISANKFFKFKKFGEFEHIMGYKTSELANLMLQSPYCKKSKLENLVWCLCGASCGVFAVPSNVPLRCLCCASCRAFVAPPAVPLRCLVWCFFCASCGAFVLPPTVSVWCRLRYLFGASCGAFVVPPAVP